MRKILLFLLVCLPLLSWSQDNCNVESIDTTTAQSLPWYGNNQYLIDLVNQIENCSSCRQASQNGQIFNIPVKIWIHATGQNNSAAVTQAQTEQFINGVNEIYRLNNLNARLYIKCNQIDFINNSSYYNNPQDQMFSDYYDGNALNIHFVYTAPLELDHFVG